MKLFLTSSVGASYKVDGKRVPCALNNSNHFLDLLKEHWTMNANCLIISSDPESEEINDSFKAIYSEAFQLSNLSISKFDVCDSRNESRLADIIYDYDVLFLAGGHVPTQNQFFDRIQLAKLLRDFEGVIIGNSAGTMNCADIVYAQPEIEGEAINQNYQRYLDGLGLVKISFLPHFQDLKELLIDGLRVIEDISIPDSKIRSFYALTDGAYVFVNAGKSVLYGEAYLINNGIIEKICETNKSIEL